MKKLKDVGFIVIYVLAVCILISNLCRPVNKILNRREVISTVTGKEVKNKSDNSKYLIYTKDENGEIAVFEITDTLFAWQFNSSDIYAGIEVGKTYKFNIGGSRNKFFSWYPNIYTYEEEIN